MQKAKMRMMKLTAMLCLAVLLVNLPIISWSATTLTISDVTSTRTICLTGDEIIWEALASGGEGPKTYQYELYKNAGIDPVYTRAYSSYAEFKFKPSSSGTYYVVCIVKDSTGTASFESDEVIVRDPLTLSSVTANKSSGYTGQAVTWTASASYGYGTKTYLYQLYKNDALVYTGSYGTDPSFTYTPSNAGAYHVVCTVKDTSGSASKTSADVDIYKQLVLTTLTGSRTICLVNDMITWSATASDGYGTKTYQYQLYRNGTLVYTRAYSSYPNFSYVPTTDGTYRVVCTVKDSIGSASKTSADVVVRKPVSLASVSANRTICLTGETITWTAAASDGLGAKTYLFKLYRNGALVYTGVYGSSNSFSYVPTNSGTYYVECTVQDTSGTATKTGTSVVVRRPLSLVSLDASPTDCFVDTPITWTAAASDGYGTKTYQFKLYLDDILIYTRAFSTYPKLHLTPSSDGVYHAVCTVKDASGEASKTSVDVTVDKAVTLVSVSASRTICLTTEPITWTATAADGGGTKTYQYKLYRNGMLTYTRDYSVNRTFTYAPSTDGGYNVVCTVRDSSGSDAKTSSSVVVRKPISLSGVKASSTICLVKSPITWTAYASGGYGEKTYQFKLYKDGTLVYTRDYSTYSKLTYTPSNDGTYYVECTAKDNSGNAYKTGDSVEVRKPLSLDSVTTEKTEFGINEQIAWQAEATGGIGEKTYQYKLYKDGTLIYTRPYSTYPGLAYTPSASGTYYVICYVNDNTGSDLKRSADVTASKIELIAPKNLGATSTSLTSIILTWDSVPGASYYQIWEDIEYYGSYPAYRSASAITKNNVAGVAFNNLVFGKEYRYRVVACEGDFTPGPSSQYITAKTEIGIYALDATHDSVKIGWDLPPGSGESYLFQNKVFDGHTWGSSYTFDYLYPGETYHFSVTIDDIVTGKGWSVSIDVSTLPILDKPKNFQITSITSTSMTLLWDSVPGAGYYLLDPGRGDDIKVYDTSYTVDRLEPDTTYYFHVKAVTDDGDEGEQSATLGRRTLALLSAPQNVYSSAATSNSITLKWDNVTDASYYMLYMDGDFVENVTGTSYTRQGLAAGTSYSFRIVAVDAYDDSGIFSDSISVSTKKTPLPAPTQITCTKGTSFANLAWSVVPGASYFKIYQNGTYLKSTGDISNYTSTIWVMIDITQLTPGAQYGYKVAAFTDDDVQGAYSDTVYITIDELDIPNIISTTMPDGTVGTPYLRTFFATSKTQLTWSKISGILPDGLTLTLNDLNGTPTAAGTYNFTLKAQNSTGSDTQAYTIVIHGAPEAPTITTVSPLPAGVIGTPYNCTITATGTAPITWYYSGILPDGLVLNENTIIGTPKESGTFTFTVFAQNGLGNHGVEFSIVITSAPVAPQISSETLPGGKVGSAYSAALNATGSEPITWTHISGQLPAGLSLNGNTLSGTPTVADTYSFTLNAENAAGNDTQSYSVIISAAAAAPTITQTTLPDGKVGTSYSQALTATGTATITWSCTSGTLPEGLALSGGTLSGTPSKAGTYPFTLKAQNDGGYDTHSYTVIIASGAIAPTITRTALPDGTDGTDYSQTLTAAGTAPITWSVISGDLPSGLSISGNTLIGTPTTPGPYSFTLKAENSAGYDTQAYDVLIYVEPVAPDIRTTTLLDGTKDKAYNQTLSVTGTPTIFWTLESGTMPAGLDLIGNILCGTPTQVGTYGFTVKAENSAGSDTQTYTVRIAAAAVKPTITTSALPDGKKNVLYDEPIIATGTTPIAWSVVKASTVLPTGLSINPSSGVISGMPSEPGEYYFTILAQNSAGYDSQNYTVTIAQPDEPLPAPDSVWRTDHLIGQISFGWSAVAGAKGYHIFVNMNGPGDPDGFPVNATQTTYTYKGENGGGLPDSTYTFNVAAIGANNSIQQYSATKVFDSIKPLSKPATVSASAVYHEIKFTWSSVDGAAKYRIYLDGNRVYTTTGKQNTYTYSARFTKDTYSYYVVALDEYGNEGTPSSTKWITAVRKLVTPALVKGNVVKNAIPFSWQTIPYATKYIIYNQDGIGIHTNIGNSSTSYTYTGNDGILREDAYQFYVIAYTDDGDMSNPGSLYVLAEQKYPAPLHLRSEEVSRDSITIKWDAVPKASLYLVSVNNVRTMFVGNGETTYTYEHALTHNTTYKFEVCAVDNWLSPNVDGYPSTVYIKSDQRLPAPWIYYFDVTGLRALTANWTEVTGAEYYKVYLDNIWIENSKDCSCTFYYLDLWDEHTVKVYPVDSDGLVGHEEERDWP